MIRYATLILLFVLPSLLSGQYPFQVSIDTNKILIGDHIHMTFHWQSDQPLERIEIDRSPWDSLSMLEWIRDESIVHKQTEEGHMYEKEIVFTFYDSGQWQTPSLPVKWKEVDQQKYAESPPFIIVVSYPTLQSEELAPIKPIFTVPLSWQDFRIALYILLFIVLLVGLWFYQKNRKSVPEEIKVETPDPHELAFSKLMELEQRRYLDTMQYETFQVELSYIIREFLDGKYQIPALESTSQEILSNLRATNFPERKRAILDELLNMADLVKFAKEQKEGDFHRRMLLEAKELIKGTAG